MSKPTLGGISPLRKAIKSPQTERMQQIAQAEARTREIASGKAGHQIATFKAS
jgi:hypothetical protein